MDIYALLDNSSKIIEIDITADIGSGEIYITDSGSNVIECMDIQNIQAKD